MVKKLFGRPVFYALTMLLVGASAYAGITRISGPTTEYNETRRFVFFDAAYDSADHLYLAAWGTQASGPVNGMLFNDSGQQLSTVPFALSDGTQQSGWARIIYSPETGKFLVSYVKIMGVSHHQKIVRFVTISNNTPVLGPELILDDWIGDSGTASGMFYSTASGKFLVTWSHYFGAFPVTFVATIGTDGTPSCGPTDGTCTIVSTTTDGETDSEIACDPVHRQCLVMGKAWGVLDGSGKAAYWARFIDDTTGAPLGASSQYVFNGGGANLDPPALVYTPAAGHFLIGLEYGGSILGFTADPSLGTQFTYLGAIMKDTTGTQGVGYGFPQMRYSPASQTAILGLNTWVGDGAVQELNGMGQPVADGFDLIQEPLAAPRAWNTGNDFTVIAVNSNAGGLMALEDVNFEYIRQSMYLGGGVSVALSANMSSPLDAGITVTWTASATGGTGPYTYQFQEWRPASGWVVVQDFSSSNFAYVPVGVGPSQVQAVAKDANGLTASTTSATIVGLRDRSLTFTKDNALGGVLSFDPSTGTVTPVSGAGTALAPIVLGAGYQIYPGDFDGDGLTDFIAYNSSTGNVHRYMNNGNNGFVDQPIAGTHTWAGGWTLTVLDFNADGYSDLFLYNPTNGGWWRFMSVGGDLAPMESGRWGSGWTIYPGDFNGDGYGDLFLFNKNSSADPNSGRWFRVLYNPASGFSYIAGDVRWATYWQVYTGDFDGDSQTDLFLYGPDGSWFKVFFTGMSATYDSWQTYSKWASTWQIVPGRFTADNMTDLYLYDSASGRTILAMGQRFGFSFAEGPNLGVGLQLLGTDFNADGLTDLWATNEPSNTPFVRYTMSGASVLSISAVGYFSNPGLTIISSSGIF